MISSYVIIRVLQHMLTGPLQNVFSYIFPSSTLKIDILFTFDASGFRIASAYIASCYYLKSFKWLVDENLSQVV